MKSLIFLSALAACGTESESTLQTDELEGSTWETECIKTPESAESEYGSVIIVQTYNDGIMSADVTLYDDTECGDLNIHIVSESRYSIGNDYQKGHEINYNYDDGTQYQIYKIQGKKIYFGDLESGDGETPSGRPTNWESRIVYIRQ